MTEWKVIQRLLMEEVTRLVEPLGYKPLLTQQMFVKKFAGGKAALHLAFIKHPEDFDVVANVAIRLNQLEDILNGARPYLNDHKKRNTYSFGAELGNISGVGQRRWKVKSLHDIEDVAQQLVSYFTVVGVPFIASISTIEDAYRIMTSTTERAQLYLAPRDRRASSTVALAKILGKDNLHQIASDYMKWLQDINDGELPQYKKFLDSIGISI